MEQFEEQQVCFECAVCGASAKGFHFGAFTCEGCKSFFGRTSLRKERQLVCRNGGECDVQGENRTTCKACRYQKCLRVGMSPLNSRFGRRSKYFKVSAAISAHSTSRPSTENKQNVREIHSDPSTPSLPMITWTSSASSRNVTNSSTSSLPVQTPPLITPPILRLPIGSELPFSFMPSMPSLNFPSIFPPLSAYNLYFSRLLMTQILSQSNAEVSIK